MAGQAPVTRSRSQDEPRLRRLRFALLAALALILLATPALVVVALSREAGWAFIAALATFAAGLVTMGALVAPGRSSFHAGTKIWQNDGLPGGGGSAGM
jgi:hypothetical protein